MFSSHFPQQKLPGWHPKAGMESRGNPLNESRGERLGRQKCSYRVMVTYEWTCLSGCSADGFLDLPRQFGRVLTSKETQQAWCFASRTRWLDTKHKIRMAGLPFRRSIKITQNATRVTERKSQAFISGSNQTADTRLAVRVRGKIGVKCLVMRLRFAVIREFCF